MKKIIFRADGNSETGLGHLYRIFALIEMYKNIYECTLVTKNNSTLNIIPALYNYKTIPENINITDEPEWLGKNFVPSEYWIIADGYHFDSNYQHQLKKLNFKLMYIDDLVKEHMYADVVVNHSLKINSSYYQSESYTKFALGTKYAILRPLFLEAAKRNRKIEKTDTAFICFGGADMNDLTSMATKALLKIEDIVRINVVVGAAYIHKEIFELEKRNANLKVFQNLSERELLDVMQQCNIGIAPSSNILYELCSVKMPVLSGYYVENQKNIYKGCIENGSIFAGGDFEKYTVKDFEDRVRNLIHEGNYHKWVEAQANLFDGKISERFIDLLKEIKYRRAGEQDMMLIYEWSNEKETRSNSYFSEPISLATHKTWFEKKLKDPNSIIYIAIIDEQPAGMIRYDLGDDNTVVGVIVSEKFRGRSLASEFLIGTSKLYFEKNSQPIYAYIKIQNIPSVKSFEKANYKKLKEELVHNCMSHVYKLENL